MDLTTRCPQCGATFSASLEQLQLRKGYIRCPNCAHIFDGFEAVVASDAKASGVGSVPGRNAAPAGAATPSNPSPRSAASPAYIPPRGVSPSLRGTEPPVPEREEPVARQPAFRVEREPGMAAVPHVVRQRESHVHADRAEPAFTMSSGGHHTDAARAEPRVSTVPDDEAWSPDDDSPHAGNPPYGVYVERRDNQPEEASEPDFLDPLPARRGLGFYFWGMLCVLGLALLLAQSLYVYRAQIAAYLPAARPLLEQACVSLHCRVPYSRNIGEITIMNSSLQTPASAHGAPASGQDSNNMVLRVTLRNSLDRPQEWPTLVLDLLDFSGTVVVKKDLPPASYLPVDVLRGPFAAHSEVTATVPITMHDARISGFQLSKYFS